ncbi:MAG: hypothetical protein DRR06_00615 [Gammaproteobacteria bacterium]|nr:MAG: hypothetical protein DRR06_00615 [Gammaproteobacteria bacterium]RLA52631.1 MAG: hypothetical protein DRR42_07040 [Gammaproteobacteria bacterium]
MQFQLKKLVIWPEATRFLPRVVEFELGSLNVITGGSRTGKSAIIPIIDYCLASSDCNIPIDTIRDHASWYGVVVQTDVEEILLCRRVPTGNSGSNDFFVLQGKSITMPLLIDTPNQNTEGVKILLNTMSSVPYFARAEEDGIGSARLGFRDLMALVFQSQDIVANQNIIFYKTHAHEHRQRLRTWFPYILGAENMETLSARQRLQVVERRLNRLKREWERAKGVSETWTANIYGHLKVAKEYGLIDETPPEDSDPELFVAASREVLQRNPEEAVQSPETVRAASGELLVLEREDEMISSELASVKRRINDVSRLKSGLMKYSPSVKRRVDRLQLSQWISDLALRGEDCPICGGSDHPNAGAELNKVSSAFKILEEEAAKVAEIPTSFDREQSMLQTELMSVLEKKRSHQNRYDLLISKNEGARKEFDQKSSMYQFLGHMRASLEHFEKLSGGGEILNEIEELESERVRLREEADEAAVERRLNAATADISQKMLSHLRTLDVEEKYRTVAPIFDVKELGIKVRSNDGSWHFLAEVGSASNWVSFHVALICGLHEYLDEMGTSCVPTFTIFDQPSQVYFPSIGSKIHDELEEGDPSYRDEDVEAVKSIFKTLASSVIAAEGKLQFIVLDHADAGIYGNIEGVNEVETWREGKKLIPEEWYI